MDKEALKNGAVQLGLDLTPKQLEQFSIYKRTLEEGKAKANLTSIEGEDIVYLHFLDSLTGAVSLEIDKGEALLDVGSGAGFPGFPLKIFRPDIKLFIIDASRKRLEYLDFLKRELALDNVSFIHGRAEEVAHDKEFRGRFSTVVSRAVASLPVLLEYCLPFCCLGGIFCAYKGPGAPGELAESKKALEILGGTYIKEQRFVLPNKEAKRTLLLIRMDRAETPSRYPRRPGIPAKRPLV